MLARIVALVLAGELYDTAPARIGDGCVRGRRPPVTLEKIPNDALAQRSVAEREFLDLCHFEQLGQEHAAEVNGVGARFTDALDFGALRRIQLDQSPGELANIALSRG